MKKRAAIALFVLVLVVGAGTAGAVIGRRTIDVGFNDQIHLKGTPVHCLVEKAKNGLLSVECAPTTGGGGDTPDVPGSGVPAGAYSAFVNEHVVTVYKWDAQGNFHRIFSRSQP